MDSILKELRDRLRIGHHRIVFAESCTAGLVAALLGRVPGISEFMCGSMVVYQTQVKSEWLGIDELLLNDPAIGPVSEQVTAKLAIRMLEVTPQATLSAAVTGHLGPGAPIEMDGRVFFAMATRQSGHKPMVALKSFSLVSPPAENADDLDRRSARQLEAALGLIQFVTEAMAGISASS